MYESYHTMTYIMYIHLATVPGVGVVGITCTTYYIYYIIYLCFYGGVYLLVFFWFNIIEVYYTLLRTRWCYSMQLCIPMMPIIVIFLF